MQNSKFDRAAFYKKLYGEKIELQDDEVIDKVNKLVGCQAKLSNRLLGYGERGNIALDFEKISVSDSLQPNTYYLMIEAEWRLKKSAKLYMDNVSYYGEPTRIREKNSFNRWVTRYEDNPRKEELEKVFSYSNSENGINKVVKVEKVTFDEDNQLIIYFNNGHHLEISPAYNKNIFENDNEIRLWFLIETKEESKFTYQYFIYDYDIDGL